jgi:hypothetical protein
MRLQDNAVIEGGIITIPSFLGIAGLSIKGEDALTLIRLQR